MTTGQHKTLAPPPPYRNAVVVIAIAIGLVGSPAEQPALLAALKRATHGGLALATRTPLCRTVLPPFYLHRRLPARDLSVVHARVLPP